MSWRAWVLPWVAAVVLAGPWVALSAAQSAAGGSNAAESQYVTPTPTPTGTPPEPECVECDRRGAPSALPFTGLQVLLVAGAGAGLLAVGLGLRRSS